MGHAGRQEADARQLLATDHLAGPQLNLPIEIVANLLESLGHVVQGVGELGHLVAGVEPDAVAEVARGHPPRAVPEQTQRTKHPAVGEGPDRGQQGHGRYGRRPGRGDERPVAVANLVRELVEPLLEERRQRRGEHRERVELGHDGHERVAVGGGVVAGGRAGLPHECADLGETGGDPLGRVVLAGAVGEGLVLDVPRGEFRPVAVERHTGRRQLDHEVARGGPIAGAGPGVSESQRRHVVAEPAGVGQLRGAAGEPADEVAVGVDADEAARRE